MRVTGIPSEALTKESLKDIQYEFAKLGLVAVWNSRGVLVIDADRPDTTLPEVLRAKEDDGFPWVIRRVLERLAG